jgi:rifampin ADP-ribosylating transferase
MDLKKIQEGFTPVGIKTDVKDNGPFYHGTKVNLRIGDYLEAGYNSNFEEQEKSNYIYLTATMDAAIWGAELAVGEGKGRILIVKPTGTIDDDPNLTDMRFPGNPTRSYRSREPLIVIGEVSDWHGHSPEELKKMRDGIEEAKRHGYGIIN